MLRSFGFHSTLVLFYFFYFFWSFHQTRVHLDRDRRRSRIVVASSFKDFTGRGRGFCSHTVPRKKHAKLDLKYICKCVCWFLWLQTCVKCEKTKKKKNTYTYIIATNRKRSKIVSHRSGYAKSAGFTRTKTDFSRTIFPRCCFPFSFRTFLSSTDVHAHRERNRSRPRNPSRCFLLLVT